MRTCQPLYNGGKTRKGRSVTGRREGEGREKEKESERDTTIARRSRWCRDLSLCSLMRVEAMGKLMWVEQS